MNNDQNIKCPNCGTEIPVTDALTQSIRLNLETSLKADVLKKEKELNSREELLKTNEKKIQKEVQQKVEVEKIKILLSAKKEAEEKNNLELLDLQKISEEKDVKLREMQDNELELRKQKREIEEKEKSLEIEFQRKIDIERQTISEKVKSDSEEEGRLKIAEKDKQLEQMRKTIDDLKRKSEQGSTQIQGDVQENDIKILLQNSFPVDLIEDVPTGIKGADIIQKINSSLGQEVGIIIWESKNTKAWQGDWIKKLKDDQSLAKADLSILVSQILPEGITSFTYKNGVWVCGYKFIIPLVTILRQSLGEIYKIKQSVVGKDIKMEYLYNYLCGNEFRNKIENIVNAFSSMQTDLETEKRALQKIWKKREKEIERVIINTSGMYGDLQGIVGASLPDIQSLELPNIDDNNTEDELKLIEK
jgi:hypothetical protein